MGSPQDSAQGGVAARLAAAGIEVPPPPAPVAAYVPAVRDGDRVWTAGQLPFVAGILPVTGKVGTGEGCVSADVAYGLARTCALNALGAALTVVDDLKRLVRVIKMVVYVASAPDFFGQAAVANGASELIAVAFTPGHHARSTVGVNALPLDASVEVELVLAVR